MATGATATPKSKQGNKVKERKRENTVTQRHNHADSQKADPATGAHKFTRFTTPHSRLATLNFYSDMAS